MFIYKVYLYIYIYRKLTLWTMITKTINFHMLLQHKTSIHNGFSMAMLNNQRV